MTKSKRIAVLYGGWSAEREVSLVTGAAVDKALRAAGYDVTLIDVKRDLAALVDALSPAPDAVFNALHGRGGEDGTVQAVLDFMQIPYTHSGVAASALAMDKPRAKAVLAAHGVLSPKGMVVTAADLKNGEPMERPYVIKPVNEGSSVGVHIVREGENALPHEKGGWDDAEELLVEEFIKGRELTVAVMSPDQGAANDASPRALAVTDIVHEVDFYDYDAKYVAGGSRHIIPADIPGDIYAAALAAAVSAHENLGCAGVTRSDFRWDPDKGGAGLYYLETNTQPGLTPTSLVPEQAAHAGMSFEELVSWMVENAQCHS